MRTDPKIVKLAEIIKNNPGCLAVIDNDCWDLYKKGYRQGDDDYKKYELATSSRDGGYNCGYGSGNCYGGDILQALALIVGVKVESV